MHESLKVYLKDRFVGWLSHESTGDDAAFASISRDSFSRMAIDCSISPKLVLGRLDDMAKRIVPAASRLADDCNARYPSNVYSQILSVIKSNISRIDNGILRRNNFCN